MRHSLACDAFEKGEAQLLSCFPANVNTCACLPLSCVCALCCALLATGGNVRCRPRRLAVTFYEGFGKCEIAVPAVSSILLRSLTPAGKVGLAEFTNYCCRFVYLGS